MSYVKRMVQRPISRMQQLAALAIIAALAFSLGVATGPIAHHLGLIRANDQASGVVASSEARNQPSQGVSNPAALARVPYEAGWQLYDDGWAGGPAVSNTVVRSAPALARVPYEAGWQLYDSGWAGGPRTAP